uniref:Uncharacterized protein n=1 Tax=viral metagenome TaxID=1070528 RepID=A0A6C0K440_9ZZZZ
MDYSLFLPPSLIFFTTITTFTLFKQESQEQETFMEFDNMGISTKVMDYIFTMNMRSTVDTQLEYLTLRNMYLHERDKFVIIYPLHTSNNETLHHITFDVVVNEKWSIRLHLYTEFRGSKIMPLYLTKARNSVYIDFRIPPPPPGFT